MTQAMVMLPSGALARVDVYRDGDTVTIRGVGEQPTPGGPVKVAIEAQMPIAAFQFIRQKAIARIGSLAYTRILGRLGIDDNVMRAPPLPMAAPAPRALPAAPSPFARPATFYRR